MFGDSLSALLPFLRLFFSFVGFFFLYLEGVELRERNKKVIFVENVIYIIKSDLSFSLDFVLYEEIKNLSIKRNLKSEIDRYREQKGRNNLIEILKTKVN